MRELKFTKETPAHGTLRGVMRFMGREIYFKSTNTKYSRDLSQQLRNKGALILEAKGWIKIDLFANANSSNVIIGSHKINLDEDDPMEIESKLIEFYFFEYTKAGFTCELK